MTHVLASKHPTQFLSVTVSDTVIRHLLFITKRILEEKTTMLLTQTRPHHKEPVFVTSIDSEIHLAASDGNLERVKKLGGKLKNKNPPDDDGLTPMHLAAWNGHLAIVKFLVPLVRDKNPKARLDSIRDGKTPLHMAAEAGHLDVIEYILEHIDGDINPTEGTMATVLHFAAQAGHLNVVSFYTRRLPNPNPVKLTNDAFRGWTPLHNAAGNGHLPVVKHICNLIEDKNPQDAIGFTPLHNAAYRGHLEVVKYLLQFVEDKEPRDTGHWGEKTPLDWAKAEGHWNIINFFQRLDANSRLKERRAAKANKHVKTSTVTQGNDEEYDIDSVLQSLGIDEDTSKKKPKKKKSKKPQKPQNQEVSNIEQPSCDAETVDDSLPLGAEPIVDPPLPVKDECSICFEPRNPTYLFFPCGHATFCKDCALRLSENKEKRCPDCRTTIQGTCRVFGTIGSK